MNTMLRQSAGGKVSTSQRKQKLPSGFRGQLSNVVMTQTPLRISFAGGGTDLPDFYRHDTGAVLSAAIDKYVYVTVKGHSEFFNEPIRLNYSTTEQVNRIDELDNNIARECLRFLAIDPPVYISTVGDMPASSGLGGSSAFTVGLLNALHAFRGERVTAGQLAEEACHIEMDVLAEPIGKQDQYAAAFGGLNLFRFEQDGLVTVEPQRVVRGAVPELFESIMMFWTGHQRPASSVLAEQKANTMSKIDVLTRMRDYAYDLRSLCAGEHIDPLQFGEVLDSNWNLKRQIASTISNDRINEWYDRALSAGAKGGKICGAGGGGFLMFIVEPENQENVRNALSDIESVNVGFEVHGSRILFSSSF
jgi:D-glycero-alpha-D-manno-heptose-7-phosphate kinase